MKIKTLKETGNRARLEIRMFISILILAAVIISLMIEFWVIPALVGHPHLAGLFRTVSESLITATLLAVTFELLLSSLRDRATKELLDSHSSRVLAQIDTITLFSAKDVFTLIRDIARQTEQLPTLYAMPRRPAEYNFATSMQYFEKLIKTRRAEIVEILREWVLSDNPNVRFLASDFIGHFGLGELRDELLSQSWPALASLEERERVREVPADDPTEPSLSKADAWVLNYVWAASRCEDPIYGSLGTLLADTSSESVQRWILFVPRQMPHPAFYEMIKMFLGRAVDARRSISVSVLKDTIVTLSQLVRRDEHSTSAAKKIVEAASELFEVDELRTAIDQAWEGLDPKTKPDLRQKTLPRNGS